MCSKRCWFSQCNQASHTTPQNPINTRLTYFYGRLNDFQRWSQPPPEEPNQVIRVSLFGAAVLMYLSYSASTTLRGFWQDHSCRREKQKDDWGRQRIRGFAKIPQHHNNFLKINPRRLNSFPWLQYSSGKICCGRFAVHPSITKQLVKAAVTVAVT